MIPVVVDRPYRFVTPFPGTLWPRGVARLLPWWLRRSWGVHSIEFRGVEHLTAAFEAGHGIMLAPNHARPCDPFVIGSLPARMGRPCHFVAASHVFTNFSRWQAWLLRRTGAFSVHRWGLDRESLKASIQIVSAARRPLMLFPEGMITRTNDRLGPLLDGAAFIARTAARHRAEQTPPGSVVVIPVAIRYLFRGDLLLQIEPVLREIERRISWQPNSQLPLVQRIRKISEGLLTLKEIEYLGSARSGSLTSRTQALIEAILRPHEQRLATGSTGPVVERVKRLRTAVLPVLLDAQKSADERTAAWQVVADCYLSQQLDCYPSNYLAEPTTAERLLETVERFEEDLTDTARVHGPLRAIVEFDRPISVQGGRERRADTELISSISERLRAMLAASERECTPWPVSSPMPAEQEVIA